LVWTNTMESLIERAMQRFLPRSLIKIHSHMYRPFRYFSTCIFVTLLTRFLTSDFKNVYIVSNSITSTRTSWERPVEIQRKIMVFHYYWEPVSDVQQTHIYKHCSVFVIDHSFLSPPI
jgi:hypothetical protein